MSLNVILDKKLVITHLEASSSEEVLQVLAEKLAMEGYVKPEYIEAIQQREKEYPTGLPSSVPAIAIPHANYELVNKTTLAIATLKRSVMFHNMEDVSEKIPIQIVIMMAIGEPHGQIEMLQKIVTIIQDEALRIQLLDVTTKEELVNIIETSVL